MKEKELRKEDGPEMGVEKLALSDGAGEAVDDPVFIFESV